MTKTRKARLVPLAEEHLPATLEWLRLPSLRRQIDSLDAPSREENLSYWRKRWSDRSRESYAILDASGRHVGNCGLTHIDLGRKKAELWIYLGERQRGGIGSEVVLSLLRRSFEVLNLNKVSVRVLEDNAQGLGFFRSLGFSEEGRARQDTCWDGKYVDSVWFSMLLSEFQARFRRKPAHSFSTALKEEI